VNRHFRGPAVNRARVLPVKSSAEDWAAQRTPTAMRDEDDVGIHQKIAPRAPTRLA
jgi:hypothetical protein